MGQPTPPGDMPLFEGLGTEWNDIVSAFPEDRRAELAPKLKERIDSYEPLRQWEDLSKSGITAEQAGTALNLFSMIENNPRQVYEAIGNHLGISPQQAQEVVEELEDQTGENPELQTLKQQVDTMAQILVAQRQQETESQRTAQAEAALDKEMTALKNKYGEDQVNEREILMRMMHDDMSAEQAYQDYSNLISEARKRRPAPMLLSGAGAVPSRAIDPTKLNNADTKNLVVQMLQHSSTENKR